MEDPPTRQRRSDDTGSLRLRRLREVLGWSQRQLAVEFGVAHGAIGLWEAGRRPIPGPVRRLLEIYENELGIEDQPPAEGARPLRGIPTSFVSRTLSLSRTAVVAAVTRVRAAPARDRSIAERARIAVAEQIADKLGEMKGLAMKLGQMAGYLDFGTSPPVRQRLARLHTSSAAMSPSVVAQVFLEELGKGPRRVFADWSPRPLAAASIGQVHRARLPDGQEVAVKVQYPRIAEAVQADLAGVTALQRAVSFVFRGFDLGPLVAELRARFLEECDYRTEAEHQERFRALWRDHPGVRIPRVFADLSTRRILVSELVGGEELEPFAARASQAERDRAGELLFDFAYTSMFTHGLFNADPHPGNYLFGPGRVSFLDFGCVKRLDAEGVIRFKQLARAILERDFERLRELSLALGMVRSARFDFTAQWRTSLFLYEPFLREGPYRFTHEWLARSWRAAWVENRNRFHTNMPADWLFLPRLQWGLYAVLARLGAEADWRAKLLDLVYEPGAPRPRPYSAEELTLLLDP